MDEDIYLKCIDVIREHNNLVTAVFMILDEELARLEFLGIHAVKEHTLSRLFCQILAIKFRCHWTPNFSTL
jgi:hypothetical protein